MRFLADESCDFRVVRALRIAGHEVKAVVEAAPGAEDEAILAMAIAEQRIFLTEDRDFGRLVYAAENPPDVILLRFPSSARGALPGAVVDFVASSRAQLGGRFVVIEPGRI